MSQHGIIRRYTLEIEKIKRATYPSFEEIKTYLDDFGFNLSSRTLQRDLESIRYEFGLDVQYHREKNGYYIDYENSLNIDSFFRFLEIVNTAELLTESLKDSRDALGYISFDMGGGLKGIELLKPILKAIKDHQKISFHHHSFESNLNRKFTVEPYLLKEYQNRWYVIAYVSDLKEFRTFGIDRIDDLQIELETFVPNPKHNPAELFTQVVGLVYTLDKQQEIILSFTPKQGKYIKTLPLHNTQKVIVDNEQEFRISLFIIPNYEFIQLILKHGQTVKVLEPKTLVDEIKVHLANALSQY
jgi:predicted DNA-binding transcriptional regulator YafY